ncbi:hypothetical protein QBC43DRAFT_217732 [Cladorrhinum sp. PSN259]|nr:hypothetical protein QBC43DRAFT_217732 [Cladorrhinum sp. PSN259]
MLRRRSLKSTSDLKRRKSTSSTHGVHLEHLDAAQAQRDAQIAASQAYVRAQSRSKSDMTLFPPTPESSPRRQHLQQITPSQESNITPSQGRSCSQGLRHRQSVRFVGPCSLRGKEARGLDADTRPPNRHDDYDASRLQSCILGKDSYISIQPPSYPHRAPPPIPLSGMATGYLASLAAADEYYTPEDNIASLPSSYRRLRRSRSMFSSDAQGTNVGSEAQPSTTASHTRRMFCSEPRRMEREPSLPQLRAPKSMSFLKNRHLLRSESSTNPNNGRRAPTFSEASDFQEAPYDTNGKLNLQSTSKTTTLFEPRSVGGGTESRMRKSLRSSSSSAEGLGTPLFNPVIPTIKQNGLKGKARKVSKSFKTKLKSFFTISKSEDITSTIPSQHIKARRTHVTDGFVTFRSSDTEHEAQSDDGWRPIRTVQTKMPSFELPPTNLLQSNKGSLESLRSERERNRQVSDDKSLTTWTHSGPSTLTSQQQQQWREWERQRLSIIKENGTHAPSSSARRKALGADLFQRPDNSETSKPVSVMPPVDCQRLYSALMKRMNAQDNQAESGMNHTFQPQVDEFDVPSTTLVRKASPQTPRTTLSGLERKDIMSTDVTDTPTRASRGSRSNDKQNPAPLTTLNPRHGYLEKARREAKDICAALRGGRSRTGLTGTVGSLHDVPEPSGNDGLPLFAPSISPSRAGERAVSDRNGTFFGSPSSHLFRTESPYRRALRRSMEEEQNAWSQRPPHASALIEGAQGTGLSISGVVNPIAESDTDSAKDLGYSESIYSTDEFDMRGQGVSALGELQEHEEPRAGAGKSKDEEAPATYQPAGYRETSSTSSVDWKTWLSSNIAKLDSSPTRPMPIEVEFALPTMPRSFPSPSGHVREATQIHGEDDVDDGDYFGIPVLSTRQPTLPTEPLSSVEPNVLKLTPLQRCIKRSTPPSSMPMTMGGKTSLPENDSPGGLAAPPPIPLKSTLRPSPLKITRRLNTLGGDAGGRTITTPSAQSSPGLTAAVQRQFGPVYTGGGDGYVGHGRGHRLSGSRERGGRYRMVEKLWGDNNTDGHGHDGGEGRSMMGEDDGARAFI